MQYLQQMNKTWLKSEKKKDSTSLLQVAQKFATALNVHFIYCNSEFPHQVSGLTTYTICRRGKKSLVDFPLSLSLRWPWEFDFCPASVLLLSRLWGLFISPRRKGSHFSLLSQPLLPIQHAQTHTDFHFSYSVRLAAPPPQGWLKTGGQTSSSVGGMHAGETLPEDLFEAAVDSADEYSKHTCGCLGWAVLWSVNLLSAWWPHTEVVLRCMGKKTIKSHEGTDVSWRETVASSRS